jgi:hypothetical protein
MELHKGINAVASMVEFSGFIMVPRIIGSINRKVDGSALGVSLIIARTCIVRSGNIKQAVPDLGFFNVNFGSN